MSNVKVYLVGAGPGDEGLITLRALELLKRADCVIYDGLANDDLLKYVPEGAELISVRKRTGSNPVTQDTISGILLEKIKNYRSIVRLKGGDPGLFGRAMEEVRLLHDAGVDFEIVPGISAGMAAPEYCGFFITDRDHSSQVIFMTGHEADGKEESSIDLELLARFNGSIVIYMGMGNLQKITSELISQGKDIKTPAAVIQNATRPNQRLVKSSLGSIVDDCKKSRIGPPAIIIIGPAADSKDEYNWFMNRPLSGVSVVITRDEKGNDAFERLLNSYGAEVYRFDSIEIIDLTETDRAKDSLNNLAKFDWVIFTSANGVRHTFKALDRFGKDARVFGCSKLAAIGTQTADCLAEYGIRADFIPDVYTSRVMAKELAEAHDLAGKKVLLLRSGIAPDDIVKYLEKAGAHVTNAPVYTVNTRTQDTEQLTKKITRGQIDWITFTSSSTVRSFFEQIDPEAVAESNAGIASIGPVAARQIEEYNIKVDLQARVHTIQGLADVIIEAQDD